MSTEFTSIGNSSAPRVALPVISSFSSSSSKASPEAPVKPVEKEEVAVRQVNSSIEIAQNAQKVQQQVQAAVEQLNKLAASGGRGLSFQFDDKLGSSTITVTNTSTGEVVRTIPADAALKVAQGIDDFNVMLTKFKGLLHDEAA